MENSPALQNKAYILHIQALTRLLVAAVMILYYMQQIHKYPQKNSICKYVQNMFQYVYYAICTPADCLAGNQSDFAICSCPDSKFTNKMLLP